jgi:metal-responsive CopG/Arc/MetJ family transcriptional regulator
VRKNERGTGRAPAYAPPVPRKKNTEDELGQFNIRMPKKLLEALDVEVEEHKRAHPGTMFTRSDLIRQVLYAHLEARAAVSKKKRA